MKIFLVALLGLLCNGCLLGRVLYYGTPSLNAPTYFDNRMVMASSRPAPFAVAPEEAHPRMTSWERARYTSFDQFLEGQNTYAFLVVKDGTIVYERYFHGLTKDSLLPCFSMSKSVASLAIGRAVEQKILPPIERKLVEFVPEVRGKPGYDQITLEHLLRMTSGIAFGEESMAGGELYYTEDLRDVMYSYDVVKRPGEYYLYGSVNIQLLWDVLHRRLGGETVSHYFERAVWEPLGAEYPASWSLDSEESGIEKFSGGFNARVRDYAKLGYLFLNDGKAGGRTVVGPEWIERSLWPDPVAGWVRTTDNWVRRGQYQWFLTPDARGYFAKGYNGQYVFVVPEKRMVFVRFGEGYGQIAWTALFERLAREL